MARQNYQQMAEATEMFLPASAVFKGDVGTEGDARIEGQVEGNVTSASGDIRFGANSRVTGDVRGNNITTSGTIKGNITAAGRLEILAGASVCGDVQATGVLIEDQAVFEGRVVVGGGVTKPAAAAPAESGTL